MYRTVNYCTVKDCNSRVHARELCQMHYLRVKRNGSTELVIERHGMKKSPEYGIWARMITRCTNPNTIGWHIYKDVDIYQPWKDSFTAFYEYIGNRPTSEHSIDRIDSSKGYVPGNVRWADRATQMRNRKMQRSNSSGYRGVSQYGNSWIANASKDGKHVYLGHYKDIEAAAIAYDCAAIQLYGDEAKPNIL